MPGAGQPVDAESGQDRRRQAAQKREGQNGLKREEEPRGEPDGQ
jgi:hypothetical protein